MRIKKLFFDNFGPFPKYEIPFTEEEPACILLTGKNNEGKSNIILGLKLLASACRSIGKRKMMTSIDIDCFKLPQQDIQGLNIGRMLYNYSGNHAQVRGIFEGGLTVTVHLDESKNLIYADYEGSIPSDSSSMLGIIPLLGPLAEREEHLGLSHVRASINTSLAPRHLRNHLAQILNSEEYELVQKIIETTWPDIKLLDYQHNYEDNILSCFFKEGRIERELAWAGQGLQVWFQIITHLIRLRSSSILVLDEPEIYLHAEKQNELIQVLKDHHKGSVIIATHSVELMNHVDVSHIIHVQKAKRKPTLKKTDDRVSLDLVRSQIGSNFNLIASQFEAVDLILFTEDTSDFKIIQNLANGFGFTAKVFNIPLHGISEYPKACHYQEAYRFLIGNKTPHTVILDRDYYPEKYLMKAQDELGSNRIATVYTPGKEIENLFLSPRVLRDVIPDEHYKEFESFWDKLFEEKKLDAYSSYLTLHQKFLPKKIDMKTITRKYTPLFETAWADKKTRHLVIEGKTALGSLRKFYHKLIGSNLTMPCLIQSCVNVNDQDARQLAGRAFGCLPKRKQVLHY